MCIHRAEVCLCAAGVGCVHVRVEEGADRTQPLGACAGSHSGLSLQRLLSNHQGQCTLQDTHLHITLLI